MVHKDHGLRDVNSSGWICQNTTAQATFQSYGFLPSTSCGAF